MRILYHPKVGAVFVNRFDKDARVLRERSTGGASNWRAWFIGRWRLMIVKATPHWVSG